MGYVVFHMQKSRGTDSGTSAHIERKVKPSNADEERTHLNRRLVEYPDGIQTRTQAIQHRLETAGLTRKVGKNQVRAIRIMLSGSPDDMQRIVRGGRLDEWCADNMKYLAATFGKENIVSADLHLDETSPHIHATLVPIVTTERKRRKQEERATKRYRMKSATRPRLCADEVMSRVKLKGYQDTYAAAMAKYGLRRGIEGSEARHVGTQQFYREVKAMTDTLKADVTELQKQKETTQEELNRAKKEVHTERLKGATTAAATNIAESVGAIFGSNRVKTLERENIVLHREVVTHEETIEALQAKILTMQAEHSRELTAIQAQHTTETTNLTKRHEKEVSLLKAALSKAMKWFLYFREMIRMESVCLIAGFDDEQTSTLIKGKPLKYSGKLYSEEHNCKFWVERVTAQITPDPTNKRKLQLNINEIPFGTWCREKFEKLEIPFANPCRGNKNMKGQNFEPILPLI
ncbi:MobV family relaxase [uncultured Alistipes sp.]|uniref:MobV family relaxase n=1 Tax=uncultured Alistipes sp. TaxID=538949 RepID=UPI0025FC8BC8|nr:MobV family relaxase [uncultured Alistipes sp.]